jgi:tetratricopeptide (TPR) repeat protein
MRRQSIIRYVATLFLLVAWTALATAKPSTDPYVEGNTAAARGDHRAAATAFEQAIAEHGWSTNTLLALANAYASVGDLGRGILALERAQLLSPNDASVSRNLATLRDRAAVPAPHVSRIDHMLGSWPTDNWTWLALGGLTVATAGMSVLLWTQRRHLARAMLFGGVGVAAAAGAIALRLAPDPHAGIVLANTPATIAPFAGAEPAFTARPGERISVEDHRGDWLYVRADANRAGWLPDSAVDTVIPTERSPSGT